MGFNWPHYKLPIAFVDIQPPQAEGKGAGGTEGDEERSGVGIEEGEGGAGVGGLQRRKGGNEERAGLQADEEGARVTNPSFCNTREANAVVRIVLLGSLEYRPLPFSRPTT